MNNKNKYYNLILSLIYINNNMQYSFIKYEKEKNKKL